MSTSIWNSVQDFFFPPTCVACGSSDLDDDQFEAICDGCFFRIREASYEFYRIPPFDRIVFYGPYNDPILLTLIHAFKYRGVKNFALPLAQLAARALEEAGVERLYHKQRPLCTSIPLHPLKERLRGYNQSALLAKELGVHFSSPVLPLLKRTWLTPPQARVSSDKARKDNIKGSFQLLVSHVPETILLVDDVLTSGATLAEAGRLLKRGGARTLWAITVAGVVPKKKPKKP